MSNWIVFCGIVIIIICIMSALLVGAAVIFGGKRGYHD